MKKVVTLFTKLFDVLKSINREYLELKNKYYELLSDYKYQIDRNGALVRRNRELVKDNGRLKEIEINFHRVITFFGIDKVKDAIAAVKQVEIESGNHERRRKNYDRDL